MMYRIVYTKLSYSLLSQWTNQPSEAFHLQWVYHDNITDGSITRHTFVSQWYVHGSYSGTKAKSSLLNSQLQR